MFYLSSHSSLSLQLHILILNILYYKSYLLFSDNSKFIMEGQKDGRQNNEAPDSAASKMSNEAGEEDKDNE